MWQMLHSDVKQEHCKYLKRAISPVYDMLTIIDFWKLYWKYKPDIIHLHSSKVGMLGRIAFPAKKTIYTVHGFDSIRLAHRKFLPIERLIQYSCKSIVGVSHYDAKNLKAERLPTIFIVYIMVSVRLKRGKSCLFNYLRNMLRLCFV